MKHPDGLVGNDYVKSLTNFLLTWYVGQEIARWWRLRTVGVGSIWAASSNISIYLGSIFYTDSRQDKKVRNDISRYARASMALLFSRHHQDHFKFKDLNKRGTLTSREISILKKQGSYPESLWSWIGSYLTDLYRAELVSPFMYQELLVQVAKGRGGAGLIGAQMGCQLPLTYVHAVNFMVKIQNTVCALSTGYALSKQLWFIKDQGGTSHLEKVKGWQMTFHIIWGMMSVALTTMIYNAMLIVAAQMSNPFNQDVLSFPGLYYEKGVADDANFFYNMARNRPWRPDAFSRPEPRHMLSIEEDEPQDPKPSLQDLMERMSSRATVTMKPPDNESKKTL